MNTIQGGIDAIHRMGWAVQGLGHYRHATIQTESAWSCVIYPALFGRYIWLKTDGKSYGHAQATISGEGRTPLAAIENALKKLDGSEEKAFYRRLEAAFQENLDART